MLRKGLVSIVLFVTLISLTVASPGGEKEDVLGFSSFNSLIEGKVIDSGTGLPLDNYTVSFSAPFFDTLEIKTNSSGEYSAQLPSKLYTISIYTSVGELVNRTSFFLDHDSEEYLAFTIDPEKPLDSHIKGKVLDKDGEALEDATVILTMKDKQNRCCTLTTDEDGQFITVVEPGDYFLEVFHDDELVLEDNFTFAWGVEYTLELDTEVTITKPLLTLDEVSEFLMDNWLNLLFLLLTIIMIIIFYLGLLALLNFFRKKKLKILESDWFSISRTFITGLAIIGILMVLSYQISRMFPSIDDYSWGLMKQLVGPAFGIFLVIFIARLLLRANKHIWEKFLVKKTTTIKSIPQQLISMISIIIRYLIILVSLIIIVILILSAFGLKQEIWDVLGDFFKDNAGKMGFLVILFIVAFLAKKFIDIFFKELGTRSTKASPQILDMSHRGVTGLTYFIITLIFLYTLLSIGGLGAIGETFILVISMIVGLVVSFAATGSIGNMLSGLVLMSMKPFEIGDRVKVGNGSIGDVTEMGIMFTKIKNLESELQDIPNNIVLANEITNFSTAAKDGGFAVVVDVSLGYEINPRTARALMKRAALASPGVLKEPTPKIIVRAFLDHAVEYRLRSYVDNPQNMLNIRSSIMESMLMAFHTEGLEILSPMYHVRRVGAEPTTEELDHRVSSHAEAKNQEAVGEGLTMFDTLEK